MNDIIQPPSTPLKEEFSSDDETETDNILASLLTQLDELEKQQQETVTTVTDALRKQQQKVDVIRKSVREAERIIHQKYVSRQKSKIKRLRVLTVARTPILNSGTSVRASITPGQEVPLGNISGGKSNWVAVKGTLNAKSTEDTPMPMETPLLRSNSPLSGMNVPKTVKFTLMTDIEVGGEANLVGDSSFHQDEDTAMRFGDDDEYYSAPPAPVAPIAPASLALVSPTETPETNQVAKQRVASEKVSKSKSVFEMAAEVAAEAAKNKPRPLPKMRPTRGISRGGVGRGAISKRGGGSGIGTNTSSRSDSQEAESVKEGPEKVRTTRGIGIGTGRRSKPFKKGDVLGRSSISSKGSDGEPNVRAIPGPTPAKTNGFVAVNTPVVPPEPSLPSRIGGKSGRPSLSTFPAGMGGSPPFGDMPSTRPLSLAKSRTQVSSLEAGSVRNPKRVAFDKKVPEEPVLFTTNELRTIFGGGNPGSIIAPVKPEDQEKAVVKTESYICLAPDAHFDPPGTMCDNAEMIDIYGQEGPVDTRGMIFPLLKKVNKMYMYCGDYTMGGRRMLPVNEWKNGNEIVKKHWAKKVQVTEWGREFLVRKEFLHHGEIKNVSLPEIMGYFAIVRSPIPLLQVRMWRGRYGSTRVLVIIPELSGWLIISYSADDKKGLRFSATALNFHSFNRASYDKMVAKASEDNPNGLPLAPIKSLKSNGLAPKPHASLISTGEDSKTPVHTKKRRRISGVEAELDAPATTSTRQPTMVGSERGRRASRNNVNYRIAPMDEFSTEEGGKGKEVIELGDDYVEDEEEEEEESVQVIEEDDEVSEDEVDMID